MYLSLNNEQSRALSSFFFDIAKGLIPGGIGFATIISFPSRIFIVLVSTLFAFSCIKFALSLLEK